MRKGHKYRPGADAMNPDSIQSLVERVVDRIEGPFSSSWVEDILVAAGREQNPHTVAKSLGRMREKGKIRVVGWTRKPSPGRRKQSPRRRNIYQKTTNQNQ